MHPHTLSVGPGPGPSRTRPFSRSFLAGSLALALASGCLVQKQDDVSEFREAIPQAEAVTVGGPEGASNGNSSTSSVEPGRGVLADTPGTPNYAEWYGFTREVRDGVNVVTGVILGSVWLIVHTEPSEVETDEAIWGPYTDALDPVAWRFRVTRVAEGTYDYALEGRPKASQSDDDYRAVLTGVGYGKRDERHGDGEFKIDLDVARELDPFKHEADSGFVRISHDLPADITEHLGALPRSITAEVRPSATSEWFTVTSRANSDGTGQIDVDAFADTDETKLTLPETVNVASRWAADGAGRADITISGGDLDPDPGAVSAVECWGADFARSYYSDSVEFKPTEGSANNCAFEAP
jgi:hypothetical protein